MQLASILSISCIIQHPTKQHCQHKLHWSRVQKRTFRLFWLANMDIDEVVHMMMSSSKWWQEWLGSRKGPSPWGIAQLAIQKETCSREVMRNALFKQWRETEMYWGLCSERNRHGKKGCWRCGGSNQKTAGRYRDLRNRGIDNQRARKNVSWGDGCYGRESKQYCKFRW